MVGLFGQAGSDPRWEKDYRLCLETASLMSWRSVKQGNQKIKNVLQVFGIVYIPPQPCDLHKSRQIEDCPVPSQSLLLAAEPISTYILYFTK